MGGGGEGEVGVWEGMDWVCVCVGGVTLPVPEDLLPAAVPLLKPPCTSDSDMVPMQFGRGDFSDVIGVETSSYFGCCVVACTVTQ